VPDRSGDVSALSAQLDLPAAGRLVAWGNAYLTGRVSPDTAATAVAGGVDAAHRVVGLDAAASSVSLPYALARLRALGVPALRLVLPRSGDATGLPGPPEFNRLALAAGAAVVSVGTAGTVGLLEQHRGAWTAHDVHDGGTAVPLREAERALGDVLREAVEDLVRLDVARWHPAAAELLGGTSGPPRSSPLPPSASARAVSVLDRAQRLLAVVAVARSDDGAAVSAAEMSARADVLGRLDAVARRALEAACGDLVG
jgi:hypothetical protein